MPGLIPCPKAIWLAVAPVALRLGADGLSLQVQQAVRSNPCDGSAYLFRNQRGDRIKLLVWDGNGVWLCQRRLHQGRFAWPKPGEPIFFMTPEQWEWLVAGVDWQRLSALLASLIILAFLVHTALDWADDKFQLLRQKLPSRKRLFDDIKTLTSYLCFDSWDALMDFMLESFKKPPPPKPETG